MIKKISLMISLILLALLVIFVCAGVGLGSWQNPLALDDTLLALRLPRVFNALLVGLSLSVAGAALQALFENPLADPGLIGTSGGAALGVVLVLSLGFIGIGVPLAAFSGSLIVCVFVLLAHRLFGGGKAGLLIIGFIISSFCSAVVGLVLFLSDDLTQCDDLVDRITRTIRICLALVCRIFYAVGLNHLNSYGTTFRYFVAWRRNRRFYGH